MDNERLATLCDGWAEGAEESARVQRRLGTKEWLENAVILRAAPPSENVQQPTLWKVRCPVCEGSGELREAVQAWDVPGAPIPRCTNCDDGVLDLEKLLAAASRGDVGGQPVAWILEKDLNALAMLRADDAFGWVSVFPVQPSTEHCIVPLYLAPTGPEVSK